MKLSTRMIESVGFSLLMVAVAGAIYSLYSALRSEKMLTIAVRQGVESVALKKVAERFSRESGVTIRIKEFPYEELFNQEQEQVRSHRQQPSDDDPPSAFDVILIDDPWFPALMVDPPQQEGNREGIRDEGFRLKKLKRETYDQKDYGQKDFVGNTLNLTNYCPSETSCDDFYGVPFVGNSQLFCYNASDFSE